MSGRLRVQSSPDTAARPGLNASGLACVGVCGYLIGLALPLAPTFDVPLAFLAVLAALAAVTGANPPKLTCSLGSCAVLGFVATRLVSSVLAPHARGSLESLAPLLPALLLFFLVTGWVDTQHHIAWIFASLTMAGVAIAAALLAIAWSSGSADADVWARAAPSPVLVVKNDVTVVAVLAPIALALAPLRPRRAAQVLVIVFFASLVSVICVVQSRTALVTTLVAITCFAALAGGSIAARGARVALLLAGVVSVAVVVDAFAGFPFLHKAMRDWQGNGRLALWAAALAMFRDAPLLGHGASTYALHYRTYLDALQLPAWIRTDPRVTPWAHNLYLELLAEQGVVGLVSFAALGTAGLSMVHELKQAPPDDVRRLGAGAGAAFMAFLTAAFFELSFIRAWVTIVLFTLLGLLTAISRSGRRVRA